MIIKNLKKSKSGLIIITISILMSVIMLLMATILSMGSNQSRIVNAYDYGLRTSLMAESSLNMSLDYILANRAVLVGYKVTKTNADNLFPASSYKMPYTITYEIMENTTQRFYTISASAVYGRHTRLINSRIEVTPANKITFLELRYQ